jgi:hypothetical protein
MQGIVLTETELAAIVNSWWEESVWRTVCSGGAPIPEAIELRRYFASCEEIAIFEAKGRAGMLDSLRRLNRTPRTEIFWHNTNLRPTPYKLWDFCAGLVLSDPGDISALWTLAARYTVSDGMFELPVWVQLFRHGGVSVEVVRFVATLLMGQSFEDTGEGYAQFVKAVGCREMAIRDLETLRGQGGEWLTEWITVVEKRLGRST